MGRTLCWAAFLGAAGLAATSVVSCDSTNCTPAPMSCDNPPPVMHPVDSVRGCLEAPAPVTGVCDTSVNRCAPSAGLGPACAFAPAGGVFFAVLSDNDVLTAEGWQFQKYPSPAAPSEVASSAQADECARAACLPACPGAPIPGFTFCAIDAGLDASDAATE